MIIVHVLLDENHEYFGFRVKGHAGYDDFGKDIVCAAVSAVTIGMINATLELTDAGVIYETGESGLLRFKYDGIPGHDAKLLFRSMLLSLKSIEEQYGTTFLQIRFVQKRGNKDYISIKNQEV
jgi:hypothetical protein